MEKKDRYLYGLDLLRIISTIAVLIYHVNPDLLPGGYLAVCVFLVMHGYLYVVSNGRKEKFSMVLQLIKRVYRLYVPMVIVVALSVFALRYAPDIIWLNEKPETMSVLMAINNWWQINAGQSYFARLTTSPFTHMWYISMLLQAEVVLPVVYKIFHFLKKHLNFWIWWIPFFLLALGSVGVMPYLKSLGLPEMRIYFGTDARLFSILLGMSLGFLHVCDKRADLKILKNRFVSELLFIAALGELLIMFYTVGETSAFYDYGFIIATLLSLILIVLCSNEEYSLFNTLRLPVLKYLAASSYEVYLVHYPLMYYALMLTDFNQNIRFYYYCAVFVSAAILHFALGIRFKKNWKVWLGNGLKIAVLIPILFVAYQGGNDIYLAEDHTLEMQELEKQLAESAELMDQMQEDYLEKRKAELELMNDPAAMAKEVNAANLPVTGIGDSVMLGAVSNLYATFPHGDFDAKQNRSYYPLYSIVQTRSGNGTLGNPVVIGIGTNSVMPLDTMRQIIRMCGNRYVYWLTITNNWQFANNGNIKQVASEFDNVVVIDWETYSKGHSDYFYSDGIHLTPTGRQAYTNYILECISRDLMTRKMEQDKQKLMMGVGDGYLLTSLDYIRATEGMEDLFVVCEEKVGIDKLLDTINEMKSNDVMAAKVFIALGNKETFSTEQLSSVFEALSDCKVMLVKVPGLKDNMTNANIDIAVEGYENISIVDLSNLYHEHPEYFTPDRVHFNEEGSRFFADLILQEIENQWK